MYLNTVTIYLDSLSDDFPVLLVSSYLLAAPAKGMFFTRLILDTPLNLFFLCFPPFSIECVIYFILNLASKLKLPVKSSSCLPPPAELPVRQGSKGLILAAPSITATLVESSLQSYHSVKAKQTAFYHSYNSYHISDWCRLSYILSFCRYFLGGRNVGADYVLFSLVGCCGGLFPPCRLGAHKPILAIVYTKDLV